MLDLRYMDSHLEMTGDLDHEGGLALLRAVASTAGDLRVDASRVQRVDGAGLTALAVARQRCRVEGRAFVVTAIAPEAVRGLRARDHLLTLFTPPRLAHKGR